MSHSQPRARTAIPTNLITGLLGAGKTSAVIALARARPQGERWAVLVNELGTVGIDGALLQDGAPGIAVREVAGGCICCSAKVALRVGITRLLRAARPDRLLIEPTGLGHPTGIYDVLAEPQLARVLELRATLCLVDPRQFEDPRFATSATALDQLTLADVLIANKVDLAGPQSTARFVEAARAMFPPKRAVVETQFGRIDPALLDLVQPSGSTAFSGTTRPHHERSARAAHGAETDAMATRGWIYPADVVFDWPRLVDTVQALLASHRFTRAKGVFRVGRTWQALNALEGAARWSEIAYRRDSRFELIAAPGCAPDWQGVQAALDRARRPTAYATPAQ